MHVEEDVLSLEASSMSHDEDSDAGGEAEVAQPTAGNGCGHDWEFTPADAELLVRLVKLCQKKGYAGAAGSWKVYLKMEIILLLPQTLEAKSHDPARQPWNVLADFIDSLRSEKACLEVQRLVDWERRLQEEDELAATSLELGGLATPAKGSIWKLVRRTQAHPRFAELYNTLPAFKGSWQRKRNPPTYDEEPQLLAVDCEMCATASDDKALLSLCMVDVDGNTRLQELVKPDEEVIDYRTALTGLTADDLANVRYSQEDAQRDVLAALEGQVVLIGHALHHDLRALRLDFQPVIDTSLLFTYQEMPERTPALADVVGRLLGRQLRQPGEPHNVAADARAALDLALYEQQKGPTPPLAAPAMEVPTDDLRRLLVHSLAPGMRDVDLIYLFPPGCPPILEISREAPNARKAIVSFATAPDAVAAFELLAGQEGTDSMGRTQKTVRVPEGNFQGAKVHVRVMHNAANGSQAGSKRKR